MDDTAMNNGIVRYRHLIANKCARLLVGAMDYRTILNIGIISNSDFIYIASNHCVEPNGTVFPQFHITYHGSVGCQPAVFTHFRSDSIYF